MHPARGQSLVEFAMVMPIFLLVVLAVFDLGRVVWALDATASAAREGARFAVVHGGSSGTACPVGPAGPEANVPASSASCPYPSPSKRSIRERATTMAIAVSGDVAATVCYGAGCSGDTDAASADNRRGTPVTVAVSAQLDLLLPALIGSDSFTVGGSSTMLVNN
jgi:hypothetical protein